MTIFGGVSGRAMLGKGGGSSLGTLTLPGGGGGGGGGGEGAEVGRGGWKDIDWEGEAICSPWPGLLQMGFDALDSWVTESTCSARSSVLEESCFPRDDSISNSDLSHDEGPGLERRS